MKDILIGDSIRKSYNQKILLSDVSISCRTGDILALYGKNGSGKSTLLNIIFGSMKAENKYISFNKKVYDKPFKKNNLISFLPNQLILPKNVSIKVIANVWLHPSQLKQIEEDELIVPYLHTKIVNLSSGLLKYLQVKLILLKNSKFCLLDEPYLGLSPINMDKINQLILLVSKEKGIIIADHNYQYLSAIANKTYLLNNGSSILIKNKQELIKYGYLNQNP